eukprot:755241-Hanusia_phi.AAC.1
MESSAYPTPGRTIMPQVIIPYGATGRAGIRTSASRRDIGSSTSHAQEWATPGISMCIMRHPTVG